MSWFKHQHSWKEIARTYAEPQNVTRNITTDILSSVCGKAEAESCKERMHRDEVDALVVSGSTTILWECVDPSCQKLRKEVMAGKAV